MTVIIGAICADGIILGADSCTQWGELQTEKCDKIKRLPNGALIASAGDAASGGRAAAFAAENPTLQALSDYLYENRTDEHMGACQFVWAGQEGLWSLDGSGDATQSRLRYVSIGSGSHVALGFMGGRYPGPGACRAKTAFAMNAALRFTADIVVAIRAPFQFETYPGPA